MPPPLHTVVELPQFIRDAEAAGLSNDERRRIIDSTAADPSGGVEIRGSGGVRKVRFAGRGRGKSGGYRVMMLYPGGDTPVYLLALLSKGDRANFTAAEVAAMKGVAGAIKRYWKERNR